MGLPDKRLSPSYFHTRQMRRMPKPLAFNPAAPFERWRAQVRRTLTTLLGPVERETGPVSARVLSEEERPGYLLQKISFRTLPDVLNIAYLLIPEKRQGRVPAVICLQGHSTGCHISIGKPIYPQDRKSIGGGRDIAVQAVRRGYVALALEQRCFGERRERLQKVVSPHGCHDAVMHSLMLGRTMIGERVSDVMRAVDFLTQQEFVDPCAIVCTGNSGGGTVTFYAACLDRRISVAAPSCAFCAWEDSIMRIYHCADNYVPRGLCSFGMEDLACLIAPRPLVVIAGAEDPIFPLAGVKKAFSTVRRIYCRAGAPDRAVLAVGKEGHRYYPDLAWPLIERFVPIVATGKT